MVATKRLYIYPTNYVIQTPDRPKLESTRSLRVSGAAIPRGTLRQDSCLRNISLLDDHLYVGREEEEKEEGEVNKL